MLALVLPVPLVLLGSPLYLVFAVGITLPWLVLAAGLARGPHRLLAGAPPAGDAVTTAALRSAALLVAYLTVQSFFEPDYGSYLRHLTPMLPLLLAVVLTRSSPALRACPGAAGAAPHTSPSHPEEPTWV